MGLISVIVLCFVWFTNVYSGFESCAEAERRSLFYSSCVARLTLGGNCFNIS